MRVSQIFGKALAILLLCLVAFQQPVVKACDPVWFGSECQYANHCSTSDCDLDLARVNDSLCAPGWFGPGCQYVDLVPSSRIHGKYAIYGAYTPINNLGQSCLRNPPASPDLLSIFVELKKPFVITWIRIHASKHNASFEIALNMQFYYSGVQLVPECKQMWVTETVVDIFCKVDQAAEGVIISGPDVGSICSVSVSGGRNVAVKQETWQSTTDTYKGVLLESWRAVDGNTNGYLRNQWMSCTNTKPSDKNPTWGIKFKSPKIIYQVVLHNRDVESLLIRLKGFTLTCYGEDNSTLFEYTDREDTPLEEYVVPLSFPIKRVKSIQIRAAPQLNGENKTVAILSLCEVEIFGDSLCPKGTCGFECELKCNCSVRNGTCLDGEDGCQNSCMVSQCCNQRPEDVQLKDKTEPSEISLFVWVGIGIAIVVVIIIIAVVVAIWSCRRKKKENFDRPHIYDVTHSNGQYNHEYNVLFTPDTQNDQTRLKTNVETGLKTNDETRLKTTAMSPNGKESQIYDEVDDQYMEFE